MRLFIIRHGETDWNKTRRVQGRTDIPLNDYGRHLAEETALGMKDIRIDRAYTSPLLRAKETAQIILKGRGIRLIEDPRIQEFSFGVYEGMCCGGQDPSPQSRAFNLFFTKTDQYVPPEGGETVEQLYERTGSFLSEICGMHGAENDNILISSHGAALTALLNRIKGNLSVKDFWKDEVPPNCAVTIVEVDSGVPRIVREGVIYYKEKVKKWKTI